ncbi:hypothetical protein CH63R_11636 [Colletotrichum higginsianum IMI 349063]|uniref:Uncharacterized protein n=1 Tax=Colletotrichum higginsianum (strain IMI 349063) TaxID=759273 RepID=A0A1B7XYS6_COLHI|nr:hypothetical protein CH63R_11636 [Colletotrichum higginsianum IMI 349063]OBR04933.1 hypothetical protein CH63R_11636 [Colletotrichum higginsianum IMI 349063]GJC99574.1 hypothetical protein ColKHC_08400 [Colletotrichum higginsianum]
MDPWLMNGYPQHIDLGDICPWPLLLPLEFSAGPLAAGPGPRIESAEHLPRPQYDVAQFADIYPKTDPGDGGDHHPAASDPTIGI